MNEDQKTKPDLIAKTKEGYGKKVSYERIGAAWTRDDGSIYFKPYGKQILEGPVYFFKDTGPKKEVT